MEAILIAKLLIGSLLLFALSSCTSGSGHIKPTSLTPGSPSSATSTAPSVSADRSPESSVRRCERQDLRSRYLGGGAGGQTLFGVLVVRNVSAQPCRVSGGVEFAAYFSDGTKDVNARADGHINAVRIVLPARMPPFKHGHASADMWVLLSAPQFNAQSNCQNHIAPAVFVWSIAAITFRVANNDPGADQNRRLAGCDATILLNGPVKAPARS
jgi:hypothetical protein